VSWEVFGVKYRGGGGGGGGEIVRDTTFIREKTEICYGFENSQAGPLFLLVKVRQRQGKQLESKSYKRWQKCTALRISQKELN